MASKSSPGPTRPRKRPIGERIGVFLDEWLVETLDAVLPIVFAVLTTLRIFLGENHNWLFVAVFVVLVLWILTKVAMSKKQCKRKQEFDALKPRLNDAEEALSNANVTIQTLSERHLDNYLKTIVEPLNFTGCERISLYFHDKGSFTISGRVPHAAF